MAFVFERDEKRPEVRKDVAGSIRFYPKLDGTGNVVASAVEGDNTVSVYSSSGELISGPTSITPTTESGISRLDIAVPAISELGENLYAVLTWKQSGASTSNVETIYFDVVLQPWGESTVSLNDMQMRVPGIAARLERQRLRLASDGSITAEQLASHYGALAHDDLYRRLQGRIALDTATSAGIKTRPRLITNRRTLHPIEVALALTFLFRADLTEGPSFDGRFSQEARSLHDEWSKIADAALASMGPLEYDVTENRVVDAEVLPPTRAVRLRRMQG